MKKTVASLGEFGLIDFIRKNIRVSEDVLVGIGDDTAVYQIAKNKVHLMTTDAIVEDVDFRVKKTKPEQIGRKALAINLSDIAAMGGTPKFAVVTLILPKETPLLFVTHFFSGLKKCA